jgi:hypothetical protein
MRKPAVALAALGLLSVLTAVAPVTAEARDWDHGWNRGWQGEEWREHRDNGPAIAFGVIGGILAGAAIASTQAYAPPAYYHPPAYYYPPAYYGTPYGYAGYGYYR